MAGARQWVVLTADARIRYRGIETDALMGAGVRCFLLVGLGAGHPQLARNLVQALPRIESFLREHSGPFIAKIYRDGAVELVLDRSSWSKRIHPAPPRRRR